MLANNQAKQTLASNTSKRKPGWDYADENGNIVMKENTTETENAAKMENVDVDGKRSAALEEIQSVQGTDSESDEEYIMSSSASVSDLSENEITNDEVSTNLMFQTIKLTMF
jgi:hypothetical protein